MKNITALTALSIALLACSGGQGVKANDGAVDQGESTENISPIDRKAFERTEIASFAEPWAMTFLPDGRMLVTTKGGKLFVVTQTGEKTEVAGVPKVDYGGQGGLGDVVLAPDFATSGKVYLSWVEASEKAGEDDTRGAVVGHAKLIGGEGKTPKLSEMKIIWKQNPKVTGRGHFSHRIVFSPDGEYLFIGSGERQKMTPAQDKSGNLGKIVRLYPDGSVPKDNPFIDDEGTMNEIWTMGHRNILGLAFDDKGRLWEQEMGPQAGDELNLIQRGSNYGWPIVSEGEHYDGTKIPPHSEKPEFTAPKTSWAPVTIAPAGLIIYSGDMFPEWKGNAFIGGLKSQAIIRVAIDGDEAKEAERFKMGARIREIEQGPDGALWVLEDGKTAKLLKLTPAK